MADENEGALTPEVIDELIGALSGANRRRRQDASHRIALVAHGKPEALVAHAAELVDALERPEAQTRWEVLDALAEVARVDATAVEGAYEGAEVSLFDEGSSAVRLAAFKFLASCGQTSPERSERAWPLLSEAIQCYHGDSEYHGMLVSLLDFAQGDISADVAASVAERVGFDAENGTGYIKSYSAQILEVLAGKGDSDE